MSMKKILLFLTVCATWLGGYAQFSNFSSESKFTDNWSIGFDAGIQTNLNDWKNSHGAIFGLNLNKDLTPYFGLSIEALAGGDVTSNWFKDRKYYHNGKSIDYLSGFLTGRWNVTNSFGGFVGHRRVFEIETNVGVGYGRFFPGKGYSCWNAFQAKTGLNLNFYVDEAKSLAINIRPAVIWNLSQTGQFDSRYGVAQITAGLTYHFLTSNGTHYFVKSGVSQLQEELAALAAINANLQNQWDNRPIVEKEVFVEKVIENATPSKPVYVEKTFIVNFALNSSSLLGNAKAELDKIPSNATVNIAGYASPEGPAVYNKDLSQERADAVKKYLESRGVKVNQAIGYGSNNAESNRLAVINIVK